MCRTRLDTAPVQERDRVVELAVLGPDGADDHAGSAVAGLGCQRFHDLSCRRGEGRLAHEVLGGIAGDEELRDDDEIGAFGGSTRARLAQLIGIAGEVADHGIELSECYLEPSAIACVMGRH